MSRSEPWTCSTGCSGWAAGETDEPGGLLVEPRVVLHGARAEGVEPFVDRVVELAQAVEVLDHLHLGEIGVVGDIVRGEGLAAAPTPDRRPGTSRGGSRKP